MSIVSRQRVSCEQVKEAESMNGVDPSLSMRLHFVFGEIKFILTCGFNDGAFHVWFCY